MRYVVEDANGLDLKGQPFPATGAPPWPAGPRRVYRDGFAEIWQLPAPAPAFGLRPVSPVGVNSAPCSVTTRGWDEATVSCDRPSVLVRRVEYFPGWKATGDGYSAKVTQDETAPASCSRRWTCRPARPPCTSATCRRTAR